MLPQELPLFLAVAYEQKKHRPDTNYVKNANRVSESVWVMAQSGMSRRGRLGTVMGCCLLEGLYLQLEDTTSSPWFLFVDF